MSQSDKQDKKVCKYYREGIAPESRCRTDSSVGYCIYDTDFLFQIQENKKIIQKIHKIGDFV